MSRRKSNDEIDELIELLEGSKYNLTSILKKVKRLSRQFDYKELGEFVNTELEGYKGEVPSYRIFKGEPFGVFQNRFNGMTDRQPLIYDALAKQLKVNVNELYNCPIGFSIPEMEDYEKNNQMHELLIQFTPEQKGFVRPFLKDDEERGWYLTEAYFKMPDNAFRKIIEITANKLTEYLLDLQSRLRITESSSEHFFEDGKTFDALMTLTSQIKKVKKRVILIDGYVDETTLNLFSTKKPHVKVQILTHPKSLNSTLKVLIQAFNTQYQNLDVRTSNSFHDRFLIIDDDYYHIGASLKDAGKKSFMLSLIEEDFIKKGVKDKFETEWRKTSM